MVIARGYFFAFLFGMIIIPFMLQKLIWLAGSEKTNGTMSFVGKQYAGQMVYNYSVVWFMVGRDTIWFNGKNGILFKEGQQVPVRYQRNDPKIARLNVFLGIWGDALVFGGIPVLILMAIFVHPAIIPYQSNVLMTKSFPFIKIM
jgi:hypothetical protein